MLAGSESLIKRQTLTEGNRQLLKFTLQTVPVTNPEQQMLESPRDFQMYTVQYVTIDFANGFLGH
jgi:hypothetical protein